MRPRPLLSTSHGSHTGAFGATEWVLFLSISGVWGASFLFIAIGLDAFEPGLVTWLRIALGAATIALFPASRRPIEREDWPRMLVIGVLWLALPFTLIPLAQQWIDSAVAGMLNGAMPLWTALIAFALLREPPSPLVLAGLATGFAGVVLISVPSLGQADTAALGVALMVAATLCYAISANLAAPLQQRYGAIPMAARAQWVAVLAATPFGLVSIPDSSMALDSLVALLVVGVIGTGLAFTAMSELVGRVGATRASTITYVMPVVAVVLGITVRGESVDPLALTGCALVIAGAALCSRRER